ncbi:MAG: helix-turn-helix domain-containing protein [Propionibacteriaceae bacterium]|nr:helix-turn-helix domain-containing protein [Propionibacteriaceae bacterium]
MPVQPLDVLSSPVRRTILDTLANLPVLAAADAPNRSTGLTAAELADRLNLHVTTVRHHLDRLVRADLVQTHSERTGVGRPRHHFTAHPGHLREVITPSAYKLLAEVLADALTSDAPDASEAGRRWALRNAPALLGDRASTTHAQTPGRWLSKVGALIDLMDAWGYEPTVTTTDAGRTADVCLHHCPMRDLATQNPAVACGVHRGIIEGTLEALGEGDATVSLIPFLEPDLCVASLTTANPFPDRSPSERPTR